MPDMHIEAIVTNVTQNPRSGQIEGADIELSCYGIEARISIDLEQPVAGDTREVLAFELGRLGNALRQVSQQPSLLWPEHL